MDMNDKLDALTIRILTVRRASLIQQAEGLAKQRRAILSEVGEIEKIIGKQNENVRVEAGTRDSFSYLP